MTYSLGSTDIIGWKTWMGLTANASDADYSTTDNWAHYTPDDDTFSFLWDVGGLGTAGNPTGSYTGVSQINSPGVFTVKCTIDDTKNMVDRIPATGAIPPECNRRSMW